MKKKYFYLLGLILSILVLSCEKILELDPKQSIDSSIALNSKEGIEATVISIYSRLQNYRLYGRDLLARSEALSDNTIHTENSSHLSGEAANIRGEHLVPWQLSYYAINEINLVIDALKESSYDEEWVSSILGQVHFLRALYYHNLMRTYSYDPTAIVEEQNYGGVPLMLIGVDDLSKIGSLERPTIKQVYEQIYADLDIAIANFNQIKGPGPNAPHRVTKAAVSALYSRVALYNGDWQKVVDLVDEALSETKAVFSSNNSFLADWRSEVHPESIFEIKFNESENIGSDRSLRATYTSRAFYDSETFTIQGVLAVNPAFYNIHEDNDVRKSLYRLGTGNNNRFYENYKFISKNGVLNLDNVPVIRVSELYLNRAEAYYHLGTTSQSKSLDDLNKIRLRAGLSPFNITGEALLEEILEQRRIELAFEGHRWFDLKRNGHDVIKVTGNIPFEDYRILSRIPVREITASEGTLKQNFGY